MNFMIPGVRDGFLLWTKSVMMALLLGQKCLDRLDRPAVLTQ
jgi:hypothetical protein